MFTLQGVKCQWWLRRSPCAQEPQTAPHKGRGNGRNGNRGWGGRRGGAPLKGVPGKRRRDEDGLLVAPGAGAPRYVAKAQVTDMSAVLSFWSRLCLSALQRHRNAGCCCVDEDGADSMSSHCQNFA